MSDNQTVVPDPMGSGRMDAQETVPAQGIDLVAVKLTDTGRVRPHNEDYVDFYEPADPQERARKGAIYLVADGMGGHQAGEVASRGAVELAIQRYYADPSRDVGKSLVRAVQAANQQIHAQAQADPSKAGMGTTLVAAVVLGRRVYVANVGDSRAYLINQTKMAQITEDHSWVEEQVRAGLLTHEQAKRHPQRNLVTRALGSKPVVEVDLFEGEISRGDALLLCSDGLTGRVEDREIATIIREHPPREAAQLLVGAANERGGSDNITVLIVSTQTDAAPPAATLPLAPSERAPTQRSRLIPALVGGVAVVALVLGLLWATGTIFGGKATETAVPTATTPLDATTPEPSPSADAGLSPVQTGTAAPTLDTSGPTATLAPTSTAQPEPTATSSSILPSVASPEPIATLPAPLLDSPAADAELQGFVTFRWTHTGSLSQDLAYQVLIWKQGASDHPGAAQSWSDTHQAINLDLVPQIMNGGSGQYLWSVVVVQRGTDERVSPEAIPRNFAYPGPPVPSVPTATPSHTPSATTALLPATWTPIPSDPPADTDTPTPTVTPSPTNTD
jgi:serine/threonine protein phosphatase PrpC